MKLHSLILPIVFLLPLTAFADIIVLQDATTITAYNVEEASRWVLYTTEESEDAPLQRIAIDKVFAIKTADGKLRTVGAPVATQEEAPVATAATIENNGPQYLSATPSADNAARIAAYNAPTLALKKPKGEKDKEKYCNDFLTVWGITSNSVLSDENVDIDFVMTIPEGSKAASPIPQYKTKVTNKTNSPIYIDLANSFKIRADGAAISYFNNAVYTEGASGSKGASLNLGAVTGALGVGGFVGTLASGMNVGGGVSKSATVTTAEERILMIPPHTSVFMPPVKYSDGAEICEDYEILYYRNMPATDNAGGMGRMTIWMDSDKRYRHAVEEVGGIDDAGLTRDTLKAPRGWLREFDENNTIKTIRRMVTYSTSPAFDTYTTLNIGLYIRAVMGSSQRWNVPVYYDTKYLTCDDESHLLVGVGKVKK